MGGHARSAAESGRELGAGEDDCVSSEAVATVTSAETPPIHGERKQTAAVLAVLAWS
jgi:hypothetical protein